VLPDFESLLSQKYVERAFPPVAGASHETVSWFATVLDAVGAAGVAGTVVAVTFTLDEDCEVPAAFVAVTVTA
jgi:hypothetical protein